MASVIIADTGVYAGGNASDKLIEESRRAKPTGGVPAYLDVNGMWQFVEPSTVDAFERRGIEVVTVYVEG